MRSPNGQPPTALRSASSASRRQWTTICAPRPLPRIPSAAKLANLVVHATRLDYDAYTRPEVFVLETMGRDAGWLAASCCLSGDVDLLVLPEVPFDRQAFLSQVQQKMDAQGSCYIVVSEGARYADGTYISAGESANDGFAHAVLGGAALTLKQMILDAGIAPRGVVQDLSRAARSSNFAQSKVDVAEAFELGLSAHMRSAHLGFTAQVVGVRRGQTAEGSYDPRYFAGPAAEFANFVKTFPQEWILLTTRASPKRPWATSGPSLLESLTSSTERTACRRRRSPTTCAKG